MEMSTGEGVAVGIFGSVFTIFALLIQLAFLASPFLLIGWATQAFANNVWPKPEKKMNYGTGIGWGILVWICLFILFTPLRLYFYSRLRNIPSSEPIQYRINKTDIADMNRLNMNTV